MKNRELSDRLAFAPPLWVQTEEDVDSALHSFGSLLNASVLCIASGGDTPLALLAAGAREVIAVDINPSQVAIAELKARSVQNLDLRSLEVLWLGSNAEARLGIYRALAPRLSPASSEILDSWFLQIDAHAIIEQAGMQGVATELKETEPALASFLPNWFRSQTLSEQRAFHDKHLIPLGEILARLRQVRAERWFGGGCDSESDGSVARAMQDRFIRRFRHLVECIPINGNQYAAHLLLGAYPDNARPPYLTQEGLAGLQETKRIRFVLGDLAQVIDSLPEASLAAVDISNVTDLLSEVEVTRLFRTMARALRPGGKILHRNLIWDEPYPVIDGFVRDIAASRNVTEYDRSFLYSAITIDSLA